MPSIQKPAVVHPSISRNAVGLTVRDYEGSMSTLCAGCGHDSVKGAHGFNSAHGLMPAIASGASAANRSLIYIGISGDGDSLSIGLGQLSHAIRRNLNMLYVIENNGVYGLTKGQFSASADVGTKSKKGEANAYSPIDPAILALSLGA